MAGDENQANRDDTNENQEVKNQKNFEGFLYHHPKNYEMILGIVFVDNLLIVEKD